MNHSTQQIVIAKFLSTKMHCVTHSLCLSYHYKLWEHLMNNREARMNSSMLYSVTIFYKYWDKFCLQIHAARIEVCPLYLFLKIKALLLFSLGTSVTQSIVRMWISFLKSFKWSRECLPGTRKDTSGIIATKLQWWNITIEFVPVIFRATFPTPGSFISLPVLLWLWAPLMGDPGAELVKLVGRFMLLLGLTLSLKAHWVDEGSLELGLGLFLWLFFVGFLCFFPELPQGT